MTWVKLDDQFTENPKIEQLSDRAFRLHVSGLCHCGKYLTDGHILRHKVAGLIPNVNKRLVGELISAGLWVETERGYEINDYLLYNPPAEKVRGQQEYRRRQRELHNDPGLVKAIRQRDGDACRYCGCKVNWSDRRGPKGATYDHVNPKGPNSLENVVVACRGCNSTKGGRSPEQAGLVLIPIQIANQVESQIKAGPRPDPSRPEGSRDGLSEEPSAFVSVPAPSGGTDERMLGEEQVELNVSSARALREQLRSVS